MHIMSANFAKVLFGTMNMTSKCDVTNSVHQIQMTTICHCMKPPMKIFWVRHCAELMASGNTAHELLPCTQQRRIRGGTGRKCRYPNLPYDPTGNRTQSISFGGAC